MLLLILAVLLWGCTDPVDRDIAGLIEGGDEAAEARIALNMAKGTAIEPLIAAFVDEAHPVRARAEFAQALYRLYLRTEDERIMAALLAGLEDPEPGVRAAVVAALGDMGEEVAIGRLLDHLEREDDALVRREVLVALEIMGLDGWSELTGLIAGEDRVRFTRMLQEIVREAPADTLLDKALDWLEVLAEDVARPADRHVAEANLQRAEEVLLQALELVPASKNINQRLGRFYYAHGDSAQGIAIYRDLGMVARAVQLPDAPTIDGVLDEFAWSAVAPLTQFYQCIPKLNVYPAAGRTEISVGHVDNSLYLGVKSYEPSTAHLVAEHSERDSDVWQDDCIEIFIDDDIVERSYFTFHINSRGAYKDQHARTAEGERWNSRLKVATHVAETFWTVELELPVADLRDESVAAGEVWGFNVARVRIGNAAEYGQWVPTYGIAHRPERFGLLVFE